MTTTDLEKEFDDLERSYAVDLKRARTLGKLARDAKAGRAEDRANKIGYEELAFLIPPVHPLSRRKTLKRRFYDLTSFSKEAVDHFETRACRSKNPLVVARFADITWECRKDVNYARLAFNGYLDSVQIHKNEIADDKIRRLIDLTDAVQRATEIAVSINDTSLIPRVERICLCLLSWLDSIQEYRWGLDVIQALLEMEKQVSQDSLKQAYTLAERVLANLVSQNVDNFQIQIAYATLLARLAKSIGDMPSIEKWRRETPAILAREAKTKESLVASILYQEAAKAYLDLGMKKESDEMLAISQEKMRGVAFQQITVPIKIPKVVREKIVETYTEKKAPAEIWAGISGSVNLVPDYALAQDIAKKTSGGISSVFPYGLYDDTRRVAQATTEDEILQARTARQYVMMCEFYCSMFLLPILDKAMERGCSKDTFVSHLRNAKRLNPDRIELLGVGFDRFVARDYVSCIHILAVQVEAWIRDLLDSMGGSRST